VACGFALAAAAADGTVLERSTAAETALVALRRALTADPTLRESIENDVDFNSLRDRPEFQTLLGGK
jgi:hypothetical protein